MPQTGTCGVSPEEVVEPGPRNQPGGSSWTTPTECFHHLDGLIADMLDQLLCDEEYVDELMGLQGDELIQLVDHLSNVRFPLLS